MFRADLCKRGERSLRVLHGSYEGMRIYMITGTIRSHVQLKVLENKWNQKKQGLAIPGEKKEMTYEERLKQQFQEQADRIREQNSHSEIYTKLKSGGKLTPDEIDYLRRNNPQALAKYEAAQMEKKTYEEELKHCDTKEEVERVKLNRVSSFAAQAKSITNNPYIPKSEKLGLLEELNNKLCLINEAHTEFEKSAAYRSLPTEKELEKERAEETETANKEMQTDVEESVEKQRELAEQCEADTEQVRSVIPQAESGGKDMGEAPIRAVDESALEKMAERIAEKRIETKAERASGEPEDTTKAGQTPATQAQSFEQLSQEMERYLREHGNTGSVFHISV